jgi:hypothetical protein
MIESVQILDGDRQFYVLANDAERVVLIEHQAHGSVSVALTPDQAAKIASALLAASWTALSFYERD